MLHVEGDDFTKSRDLFFEIPHRGSQKCLEQVGIEGAQFLTEPKAARQGLFGIKAIRRVLVKCEMKAQFEDEQRVLEQEATQLAGVDHAFANADEEGFEVDDFGMTMGATISRAAGLPLLDNGPIKQREESAVLLHNGIMLKQSGESRLVKEKRRR